jgi:hypothetical protein
VTTLFSSAHDFARLLLPSGKLETKGSKTSLYSSELSVMQSNSSSVKLPRVPCKLKISTPRHMLVTSQNINERKREREKEREREREIT